MRRLLIFLALISLAGVSAFAQTAPQTSPQAPAATDAAPTPEQLIDKFIKALGGKEALEKITTRTSKGKLEIAAFNVSGTIESQNKNPNFTSMTADLTGAGLFRSGFDGTVAWESNPMVGLREKAGNELADAKLEAVFHRELRMKELFPTMVVKGKQQVAGKDAWMLVATPKEGSPLTMYFDAQSGLIVRDDQERESPEGKMPIQTYYEDYREVDGVKMPFKMRQVSPMFELVIALEEVKHNGPVDEAKFKKPAN